MIATIAALTMLLDIRGPPTDKTLSRNCWQVREPAKITATVRRSFMAIVLANTCAED